MHSNHARAHKESVKLTGEGNYARSVKGGFSSEPRKDKHSVLKWFFLFFPLSFCADLWSDSDECSSDIEAAARPRPFSTDDFDDFGDWHILDRLFSFFQLITLGHRNTWSRLPYANSPFDHCFSAPCCKPHARLIAKTNKVDSSQDG